jgi:hypothetical protein
LDFQRWLLPLLLVALPAAPAPPAESSTFYMKPATEPIRRINLKIGVVAELAAARRASSFPQGKESAVPERLRPLVMDFAALLAGPKCRDYRWLSTGPAKVTGPAVPPEEKELAGETWVVQACGAKVAYHVLLYPCNPERPVVAVALAIKPPRNIFYGAEPLEAGQHFHCPSL